MNLLQIPVSGSGPVARVVVLTLDGRPFRRLNRAAVQSRYAPDACSGPVVAALARGEKWRRCLGGGVAPPPVTTHPGRRGARCNSLRVSRHTRSGWHDAISMTCSAGLRYGSTCRRHVFNTSEDTPMLRLHNRRQRDAAMQHDHGASPKDRAISFRNDGLQGIQSDGAGSRRSDENAEPEIRASRPAAAGIPGIAEHRRELRRPDPVHEGMERHRRACHARHAATGGRPLLRRRGVGFDGLVRPSCSMPCGRAFSWPAARGNGHSKCR